MPLNPSFVLFFCFFFSFHFLLRRFEKKKRKKEVSIDLFRVRDLCFEMKLSDGFSLKCLVLSCNGMLYTCYRLKLGRRGLGFWLRRGDYEILLLKGEG